MKASSGWAADVIATGRAHGVVPSYGGTDWQCLDESDPRRMAGVVIAAECWWHDGLEEVAAERLVDELLLTDQIVTARIRGASFDVRDALAVVRPMRWGYKR